MAPLNRAGTENGPATQRYGLGGVNRKAEVVRYRPPFSVRVVDLSAATMRAVSCGANLPAPRRHLYAKWRAGQDKVSPVERVIRMMLELRDSQVPIDTLRRVPRALDEVLDELAAIAAAPVDGGALMRETELEHRENLATLHLASGDRSASALYAFADAITAESLYGLELARAARREARTKECVQ